MQEEAVRAAAVCSASITNCIDNDNAVHCACCTAPAGRSARTGRKDLDWVRLCVTSTSGLRRRPGRSHFLPARAGRTQPPWMTTDSDWLMDSTAETVASMTTSVWSEEDTTISSFLLSAWPLALSASSEDCFERLNAALPDFFAPLTPALTPVFALELFLVCAVWMLMFWWLVYCSSSQR